MRIIQLHGVKARGRHLFVSSDTDYDLLMGYRWYVDERPLKSGKTHGPYAFANIRLPDGRRTTIKAHVLLLDYHGGIDHVNGYPLDCTRRNLRKADAGQNQRNAGSRGGTSIYKGVDLRRGKWRARITVAWVEYPLGWFTVETDAARACDAKACELPGEFARFNFPEEHRHCHGGTCSAVPINSPRP